ncbi:MAG TPA: PAS domain S-box protein, partial [Burkholderiaceae bacterium]|nr:PAS domain S-box protein [Burkholderiaceae bacterium]
TGIYNLMGHVYKLVAYVFLYRAVFLETVERPHRRLLAAQAQLRSIVETIPDLLFLKDVDGVYLDCNPMVEGLYGRGRAAIVGKTDYELVPREVADAFRDADRQAMTAGRPSINEEWVTFADTGYRGLFETIKTPVRDAQGQVVGVLGIARDITLARRAREAQSISEQRLAQVVRVARIGIFDHDHGSDMIYWSAEQREIYGVGPDEAITLQVFLRHVFPADLDRIAAAVQRAHDPAGDGLFDVEHRIVRSDGQIRYLTTRSQTFFEGVGAQRHKVRTIGAVSDITECKAAEDERRSLEMQLRESQKMESIGTLAGGIAHDFNNILGAILGNVALARGDLPPDHAAQQSLQQIARASVRARDLIQQILAFSRRQPQERIWQPLRPLVEESISLLRSTLPARVELQARLGGAPLIVFADGTQIQQVLMNLCTNAWHALADSAGTITVGLDEALLDAAAARSAGALPPGRYAHLWVRDTGTGMDAQTRSRVFEPFFTTKPSGQGTGLGLSVVHGIVAAHDGAITVDSAPGEGSTFHLYFPARKEALAVPAGASTKPAALDGHGEHVMYIDDDEVMVLMVERLLQRAGYRTTCCQRAPEALAALRALPQAFDVVVTDYNMPGATGLERAQAIAAIRPDLPVIVTSGYMSEELRAGAERAGVRHLLQKERTFEELAPLLRRVLAT